MKILYIPTYNKETDLDKYIKRHRQNYLFEKRPDIIFVSGGDGSLLHAIHDYNHLNVPFFGIANGTKNFLMNSFSFKDFRNLNVDKFHIIKSQTLKVKVKRTRTNGTEQTIFKSIAMNDIVLGNKIMDFNRFKIDNLFKSSLDIKGLGLVLSTAIGSTAFFHNNGGEIIKDISSNIIGASSIVSEREKSFNGHFILNKIVLIKILSERSQPFIHIDGEAKVFELRKGDKIYISYGKNISLAFMNIEEFLLKRNII